MIGAIAGDIIETPYEFSNINNTEFDISYRQTDLANITMMLLTNAIRL